MSNLEKKIRCELLDWQNEKKYQEKILEEGTATKEVLERAKARIKEAEKWIAQIEKELDEGYVTVCGGIQPPELNE